MIGAQIPEACCPYNLTEQTFRSRTKCGGMDVSDVRELKVLQSENAKLKRLLAEQHLVIEGLKEFLKKNDDHDWSA